ncbi:MAG TPA: GNAT family N-acetyltransferase [Planctomycetaceae bacterium]|nr:GNAT family N-acetyltransferase [Planctomycetaceae bacterium]
MTLHSELYDTIDEVDCDEWNSLRGGSDLFMSPEFIRAIESSMAEASSFRHVVFKNDAGAVIATACMSSYRVDASLLANGWMKKVASAIGRVIPFLTHFQIVFCGLPISAGQSNLRIAANADPAEVLSELDGLLWKFATEIRARAIVFKEFSSEDCQRFAALENLGYLRGDSLPMNETSTAPSSFEEYLAGLKSRKRSPITRSQKKFARFNYRVEQMNGGAGADRIFTPQVYKLYEHVYSHAGVRLEKLSPKVFPELARQLPDNTDFTFIYDGDEVIAFAASMFCPESFHQMFVGYDESRNADSDLYFNLFYQAIDRALRQGCDRLLVGQSADDFKHQKLSCRQRPLSFFIKGVNFTSRVVIPRAFGMLFPAQPIRFPNADSEEPQTSSHA